MSYMMGAIPSFKKIVIEDQKTKGSVGGGLSSGAWRTRTLNTLVLDETGGASLSSNQITIPAGNYNYTISGTYRGILSSVRSILYNVTDSVQIGIGLTQNEYEFTVNQLDIFSGSFEITSAKAFEVRAKSLDTNASHGFGDNGLGITTEIFCRVEFTKIG